MLDPFKFIVNKTLQSLFVLDAKLETAIKSVLGRTKTSPYTPEIERTLNFSFLEVIGGFDYVSLFLDIKHAYVITHRDLSKDNLDRDDYEIRMLYKDANYNYRVLKILVFASYENDKGDTAYITLRITKQNLWKFEHDSVKFSFRITNHHEGERFSENLSLRAENSFTSAFEDMVGCTIRFT